MSTAPKSHAEHAALVERVRKIAERVTAEIGCDEISIVLFWKDAHGEGLHGITDVGNLTHPAELFAGLSNAHKNVDSGLAVDISTAGMTKQ